MEEAISNAIVDLNILYKFSALQFQNTLSALVKEADVYHNPGVQNESIN